jgi:hypothetical protein
MILIQVKTGVRMNAGYTMLFAVLVSTVLLSIGIFILNVSKKEVLLSAIGRESALAFYAADGGVECAHYWNAQLNTPLGFDSTGVQGNGGVGGNTKDISCGGQNITPFFSPSSPGTPPISHVTINIKIDPSTPMPIYPGFCAEVKVKKEYVKDTITTTDSLGAATTRDVYSVIKTTIDSRGYNTCVTGDPRRVERGLREIIQ